ncbi:early endosome antigen 1 [Drosophila virilis]|uniref:Uncharacterized protein n=1 Tax=Drosophila virilis TaxID=7244 RepID=B4M1D3_DROVI|nr:uncharacterized protein LOC6631319 [Drosophila virilis]EDW65487.1 uncharacterized protein Dvir_GJ19282 [Drosophila virilis]
MSIENFPRVHSYIANLCASNKELHNLFAQFENALKEKLELGEARTKLQKDMQNLRIDLMLVRQAAVQMQEERKQFDKYASILDASYEHLLEMGNLLNDDKIKNMMRFAGLCKQNEAEVKLQNMEQLQKFDRECKMAMENRAIVKDFRKWQRLVHEAEEQYASIQREFAQMDRQRSIKIRRATQQRNKKIVALVQLSKQIAELETPVNEVDKRAGAMRGKKAPLVLQSALDFLSHYPEERRAKEQDMDVSAAPTLRSILVVNRRQEETERTSSPTKQVHFAPLPSPVHGNDMTEMMNDAEFDMIEPCSESSEMDSENMPTTDDLPERAIVQKVEMLPRLQFSDLNMGLSFKNLFPSTSTKPAEDCAVDQETEYEHSDKQLTSTMLAHEDSSDINDSNSLDFSNVNCDVNDDFFLNFSDGNDSQPTTNRLTYEL